MHPFEIMPENFCCTAFKRTAHRCRAGNRGVTDVLIWHLVGEVKNNALENQPQGSRPQTDRSDRNPCLAHPDRRRLQILWRRFGHIEHHCIHRAQPERSLVTRSPPKQRTTEFWSGGSMTLAPRSRCEPWETSGPDISRRTERPGARWCLPRGFGRWRGVDAA